VAEVDLAALPGGTYEILAVATDELENRTEATQSLSLNTLD
jgi:hypothetical protein